MSSDKAYILNWMAVLCGMPTIQCSAEKLSVHKLFTSCILRYCMRLSDAGVICRVTYLQFPIQACFYSMWVSQAAQRRTWLLGLPNIGHQTFQNKIG